MKAAPIDHALFVRWAVHEGRIAEVSVESPLRTIDGVRALRDHIRALPTHDVRECEPAWEQAADAIHEKLDQAKKEPPCPDST